MIKDIRKSHKVDSKILKEFTARQFRNEIDALSKERSKQVRLSRYEGITKDYIVYFRVPSATTPGVYYYNVVQLIEYKDIADDPNLKVFDKVRLAVAGDIKLSCNCPAFLFGGYKYILTQLDAVAGDSEERFPYIRNPRLVGVVCKHLTRTLSVFANNISDIASDISNGRWFDPRLGRKVNAPRTSEDSDDSSTTTPDNSDNSEAGDQE